MYEIQEFSRDGVQLLIQVLGKPLTAGGGGGGEGVGRGSGFALFICVDSSRPVKEISVMSGRVFLG